MHLSNDLTQERPRDVSLGKSQYSRTDFQLIGFWLHIARGAWISFLVVDLMVVILTLFASRGYDPPTICAFPANCAITPDTVQALHHAGIAPTNYVIYNLVLALLQSLIFLGVGMFVFSHKSREPLGLAASFVFVVLGLSPFINQTTYPPAVVFGYMYALCLLPAIGYFLLTFPHGRFVPRWSWVFAVLLFVQVILFELPTSFNITFWPPPLIAAVLLLTYGGTIGVLIYRYVRVFSYTQRQQSKWPVFGLAGFVALNFLFGFIGSLFPWLGAPDSPYQLINGTLGAVTFLILPLSVGMAIQRYRLWEIDVLIRRTLIYTILTLILALIYVGLVFVFGTLLRGLFGQQQQSPLVIVASTLVIAALFQHFRQSLQRFIDHRFYRRKYDAAKTVEAFSATVRNEVDLSQLSEHLLTVVQETMQPLHVSLWLPKPHQEIKYKTKAWVSNGLVPPHEE